MSIARDTDTDLLGDVVGSAADDDAVVRLVLSATFFQPVVRGDALVTRHDALGVALPIFSTPLQAISYMQDIVQGAGQDASAGGGGDVRVEDVTIRKQSGGEVRSC